ncbi:hypothetical protein INT48_008123 [Thamnidium elegans]|uniref:Tetratricopeptide SHNi-TPR domain-containing protein n=1 Tax=Thamnidium elegans TaxID=101142 RepID=A0A8H7VVI8_9FUNG|nr:hypothetical protein INT48_008123 [Thamnidium elegans]
MSDKEQKAKTLYEEGKLAFSKGEYSSSIAKLGEACQLLDELNGVLAPANGDAFFLYGEALLQYAIQQNTVLGQSAQASAEAVEEQQEIEKEEQVESSNPLFQLDDDFETAWDILDIARVIFEKGEDKNTQLKLADVHLCLGDVSLETEKFNEALTDYEKAIEIKKSVLEEDNRELAEAHYKYALALEFSSDKANQALPELQKAVAVLKKKIETLEAGEGKGKGKQASDLSKKALDEIAEIKEIIPDMELKIEELSNRQATEKEAETLLKAMLGMGDGNKPMQISDATPVNDLSTLVKRKVKEVVKEEEAKDKKQKLDSTTLLQKTMVVVILQGRYAGKKAVVVRNHDEGTKDRPYGYAVVAGVERSPLKVTKAMGKKKTAKRSKVKPFVKIVNYNHMMPTRYGLELEQIKGTVSAETFKEPTQREDSKKVIKKLFEERYQTAPSEEHELHHSYRLWDISYNALNSDK